MKALILAALLFLPLCLAAQINRTLKTNSPAPPLSFKTLLQAPDGTRATWDELRGKSVVLEFWATWCAGCVENISHLNQLAEQFGPQSVQFISITDETDVPLIKRFLLDHPITGWVAFDDNELTFTRFGIEARPQTVLIDSSGIVRGVTMANSVNAQVLQDLLAGKPLNFPAAPPPPVLGTEPHAPPPIFQVLIRPAAPVAVSGTSPGWGDDSGGRFVGYGLTMRRILSEAYNLPETRIDAPAWCTSTMYDLSVVRPASTKDSPWPLIKQALDTSFALKTHEAALPTPVYVLRKIPRSEPRLTPATTASGTAHLETRKGQPAHLEAIGYDVASIARVASRTLGKEAFDETGLSGRYDFDLTWDPSHPDSIIQSIRNQLNLSLTLETRKLPHLIVDSISDSKSP